MKKSNLIVCGLCLFPFFFSACSDDEKAGGGSRDAAYPSVSVKATEYGEWTYFDLSTGAQRSLKIKSQEGGVTGMYYGNLASKFISHTDSLQLIITRHTADSITLALPEVVLGQMNGDGLDTIFLQANAKAEREGDKWRITGGVEVCEVEQADRTKTDYMVSFNGTVGTTRGSAVELSVFVLPEEMYRMMGQKMNFGGVYTGRVDESYIYEVDGDESSFDWDLAFHQYDIRTNGGSAVKTGATDLDQVTAASLPAEGYVEDADGSVFADMSNMMLGFVGTQYVKLNPVLCEWVEATPTGGMPPYTYRLEKNVFVVKTRDGRFAKIQFYDMTDDRGKAVYPSFNYEYPVK